MAALGQRCGRGSMHRPVSRIYGPGWRSDWQPRDGGQAKKVGTNLPAGSVRRPVQSDQLLLRRIADGNAEALGALYDLHGRTVFTLARRVLGKPEDAEEVTQDVFAYVWREVHRYQESRASVAGWLVMLTRTRAIDRLRARQARPDTEQAADPAPVLERRVSEQATPEALAVTSAEARRIGEALEQLPLEQRALINLAYFDGLSQSDIAVQTSTPLGTVKTRMRTALQTLRAAMSS